MTGDMPTMLSNAYISNTQTWEDIVRQYGMIDTTKTTVIAPSPPPSSPPPPPPPAQGKHMALRYVQVFIADTNDSLSLEDRVLFEGEPKVTDLDDNELFFELDIKDVLAKHNAKRVKTVNKKAVPQPTGLVYLEPARVRDLKMTVVTIASF